MKLNKNSLHVRLTTAGIIAAVVLLMDQVVKWKILQHPTADYLGGIISVGSFYNFGIAFSIRLPDVLLILAIAASLVFVLWLTFTQLQENAFVAAVASGLVLGGAVGNIIDRLRVGAVVDYIHLFRTSVLNLADLFIASGLFIILILLFRKKKVAAV